MKSFKAWLWHEPEKFARLETLHSLIARARWELEHRQEYSDVVAKQQVLFQNRGLMGHEFKVWAVIRSHPEYDAWFIARTATVALDDEGKSLVSLSFDYGLKQVGDVFFRDDHRGTRTEVHLDFRPRLALHPPDG